jgi:hypothetical protein
MTVGLISLYRESDRELRQVQVVKAGKVGHIRASSMRAWGFARALGIAENHGWSPVAPLPRESAARNSYYHFARSRL